MFFAGESHDTQGIPGKKYDKHLPDIRIQYMYLKYNQPMKTERTIPPGQTSTYCSRTSVFSKPCSC